jgi:hypothetical protein
MHLEALAEPVGVDRGAVRLREHQVLVAVVGPDRQPVGELTSAMLSTR